MNNFLLSIILALDKNSLDISFYIKTLNEFSNGFGYHLQIDGEPFEYYAFEKILETCKDLQIKDIGVRTSKRITEQDIRLLLKYNVRSITFRYDSDFLYENINLAKKLNIPCEVSLILDLENIKDIDNIVQKQKNLEVKLLVLERSVISNYRLKNINSLTPEEYKYIMTKISAFNSSNKLSEFGIALSHCPNKILLHKERSNTTKIGGCSAGIISCAIDSNGNIIPCLPLYDVVLGNIAKDSLSQVWDNNETFKKLRDRNNLKGKCLECEYKNSCGGCRAESFHKNGDLFGEDHTCWN